MNSFSPVGTLQQARMTLLYSRSVLVVGTWNSVTRPKLLSTMADEDQALGLCPNCGSILPSGAVLIEYEVSGDKRVFAECPQCSEPVRPN